jgi:hypothetical protein
MQIQIFAFFELGSDRNFSGRTRGWSPDKINVKSVVESIVGTSCRSYKSQEFRFLGCDLGVDDDDMMTGNATIGMNSKLVCVHRPLSQTRSN